MKQKLLTIEMNTSDIKICDLVYSKGNPTEVVNYVTIPMPADCITSKDIFELDTIAYEIKRALLENKITTKNCIFVVNSSDIHGREMIIPPQKTIAQHIEVIKAKAEQDSVFPIDIGDNIITYTVLDSFYKDLNPATSEEDTELEVEEDSIDIPKYFFETEESLKLQGLSDEKIKKRLASNAKKIERYNKAQEKKALNAKKKSEWGSKSKKVNQLDIMAYLAPQDYILKFIELAKKLKLNLVSIDYVGNAVYRFTRKEYNTGNHLIVYLNDFNSIVSITEDGILKTQRVNHNFSYSAVAKFFYERERMFKVHSIEECFDYINSTHFFELSNKDFEEMPSFNYADIDDFIRARNEITNIVLDFFDSLTATINQYRKDTGKDIDDIVLINERKSFPNFSDSLAEISSKRVEIYDVDGVVCKKEGVRLEDLVGCLGCVISPTNFNIAESEELRRRQLVNRAILTLGVASLGMFMLYSSYSLYKYQVAQMNNEILKTRIENANEAQQLYMKNIQSISNLNEIKNFDLGTSSYLNDLDIELEAIESAVPIDKCTIESIVCTDEMLSLSIKADSKDTVAKFIIELEGLSHQEKQHDDLNDKDIVVNVPYFPFVDVASVTDSEDTEGLFATKRIVTTTIQLYFKDPNVVEEEMIPPIVEGTETEEVIK